MGLPSMLGKFRPAVELLSNQTRAADYYSLIAVKLTPIVFWGRKCSFDSYLSRGRAQVVGKKPGNDLRGIAYSIVGNIAPAGRFRFGPEPVPAGFDRLHPFRFVAQGHTRDAVEIGFLLQAARVGEN